MFNCPRALSWKIKDIITESTKYTNSPHTFYFYVHTVYFSFIIYYLHQNISLICDKSVTTKNFAFWSYWYRKKRFADALLTGTVS